MSLRSDHRPPRPSTRFAARFVLAGVIVLLTAGIAVATTIKREADILVGALPDQTAAGKEAKGALDDVQPGKPQTMLLVGDDARKGEKSGQRSDTMILVRLDPNAKVTATMSLPRDLIIAGGSSARLNASFNKGPAGLIDTLRRILSTPDEKFQINHYVSIRFTAFSKAVNAFGCFYADVDRKYFNDNNPPVGSRDPYAAIDVPAGYQRLCGEDALSYVRFRHLDNDVVREARQQHFLTEARAQVATSKLISDGTELAKTILRYVDTDIRTSRGLLGVVRLGLDVVGRPTRRIQLSTTDTEGGALQTTPADLADAAHKFLHPDATPGGAPSGDTATSSSSGTKPAPKRKKVRRARRTKTPASLTDGAAQAKATVQTADIRRSFVGAPVYVPRLMLRAGAYQDTDSRGYDIASANGRSFPWQAYRLVVATGDIGQYYGIQGTTWTNPPVLALTTDEVRLGGRTFRIEYDGSNIRRLVWQTPKGTYWINNSLKNSLSNNEMRAVARSLVAAR